MIDLKNIVWKEKYRPVNVKDVVSPHKHEILKAMENPMSMGDYIFYSSMGGTGKTSMSKAIVNDLQCDVLSLNASDERSIDTIRTKVKDFMVAQSGNPNCKKCILMDEGEKLTADAQDAIKNMMEEFSSNCFVILTTNNLHKIKEPLQTRFDILEFIQPDKNDILSYLKNICEQEKLQYTDDGLKSLIEKQYPSLRKMVVQLQKLFMLGKNVSVENITQFQDYFDNLWTKIKLSDYNSVKNEIRKNGVDCRELNKFIFNKLIDGDIEIKKEIKLIQILSSNEDKMKSGAEPQIIFIASVPQMIKYLREE